MKMWIIAGLSLVTLFFCWVAPEEMEEPDYQGEKAGEWRLYPKCCEKGEWLDSKAEKCIRIPGRNLEIVEYENIDLLEIQNTSKSEEISLWLPLSLLTRHMSFEYKRGSARPWNILLKAENSSSWELRRGDNDIEFVIKSEEGSAGRVADDYCFDAMADDGQARRVVKALVSEVTKCCRQGEVFSDARTRCVPIPGAGAQDPDVEELILPSEDPDATLQWLPARLLEHRKSLKIRYGVMFLEYSLFRAQADTSNWTVQYPKGEKPVLTMMILRPSGETKIIHTRNFCFEKLSDPNMKTQIILAKVDDANRFIKCCSTLQHLDASGTCKPNPEGEWFAFSHTHPPSQTLDLPMTFLLAYCRHYSFQIESDFPEEENIPNFQLSYQFRFFSRDFCVDVQRGRGGKRRDVRASCESPHNVLVYAKVRPLQAAAAVLLAAGIAFTLARAESRRNMHSVALAAHAACLLVTNVLQAAWFFSQATGRAMSPQCVYFNYSVYFFLMSSACWLNAVAANMAHGFRQPLGAMARGDGGWAGDWRRLALLSGYAWGVPAVLTILVVLMDVNREALKEAGYLPPSFFETRVCAGRRATQLGPDTKQVDIVTGADMASFFYYYMPCTLLVMANSLCLALTLCKIREMRTDAAALQSTRPLRRKALHGGAKSSSAPAWLPQLAGVCETAADGGRPGAGRGGRGVGSAAGPLRRRFQPRGVEPRPLYSRAPRRLCLRLRNRRHLRGRGARGRRVLAAGAPPYLLARRLAPTPRTPSAALGAVRLGAVRLGTVLRAGAGTATRARVAGCRGRQRSSK